MKNVQYYLKKYDKERLAIEYFNKYLLKSDYIMNRKFNKMTISEYRNYCIRGIKKYINRLCKLKTIQLSEKEQFVFIRTDPRMNDYDDNTDFSVYKFKDVFSKKKHIKPYSYTFTHQDEIMSYLIADTYINKCHLNDVLVDILWEASFYGYGKEHDIKIDKINENLHRAELEKGEYEEVSFNDLSTKVFGFSKEHLKKENQYYNRYNKSELRKMEGRLVRLKNKLFDASLMFQVNEIRNNNLCLLDEI